MKKRFSLLAGDDRRAVGVRFIAARVGLPASKGGPGSEQFLGIAVQAQTHFGLVAPTILSVTAAQQADVIVLCSHGFPGVTRWVMGSVAEKVARYSDIPVMVLREGVPMPTARRAGEAHPVRILVPLDGSDYARRFKL